jgi:diguanylate cyclase (GGDEF)-like protein/PAS domain S-box-containing protein
MDTTPLRVLIVEDAEDDALLMQRVLSQGGLDLIAERVDTSSAMEVALSEREWDVVLSDYSLPGFGAPQALALLQAKGRDVPFIVVSGNVGEEAAVEMMRSGAADYVMKGRLARLAPAIRRELREAAVRRERRQAEVALRASEERLRLALESGKLGSFDVDLAAGRFLEVSDTYKAQFGLPPGAELSLESVIGMIHPDDRTRMREVVARADKARHGFQAEHRVVWPDGSVHWLSVHAKPVFSTAGYPLRLIGVVQDITRRVRIEEDREKYLREAQARADRDPLTGLLNHRVFQRRLKEESLRAEDENRVLAVVMLDLDNFKFFNDAYGHVVGDEVLCLVARRLETLCRGDEIVARFGGDEFALLLPDAESGSVKKVEEWVRSGMDGLVYRPDGQEMPIPITTCAGGALYPAPGLSMQEVVGQADERLRRAKTGGVIENESDQVRSSMLNTVEGFSMLDALVTAVDNKDRYTRRHSEDVLTYSLVIARWLGFSEKQQHNVAVSALLHDVGKIGVPDAVLRKPGRLTEEEFAAIRQHPMMGAVMVSAVPGLEDTLDAVRHHHERWNGEGYPFGLRRDECPLIARLMAVADAFSAMTTDRPYRKGMDRPKALSILRAGAGSQWDPDCVVAFLDAMHRTA